MARLRSNNVNKMNRSEYLTRVAKRSGYSRKVVNDVYDAMVTEFVDVLRSDRQLLLTGFGNYYIQKHKGHPVQFSGGMKKDIVNDYDVLKFSPSNILKRQVCRCNTVISDDSD